MKGTSPYTQGNPPTESPKKKKSGKVKKDALVQASKKKGTDVEGPRVEDIMSTVASTYSLLPRTPLGFRLAVARSRGETSPRTLDNKSLVPMLKIAVMEEDTEEQGDSKSKQKLRGALAAAKFLSPSGIRDSGRVVVNPKSTPVGFLTTTGLKALLGNAQGAATDFHHQGISPRGGVNLTTPQQQQSTPPKSKQSGEKVAGPSINFFMPTTGTKTPASSSEKSGKKTPQDRAAIERAKAERELENKKMLDGLMTLIDSLGEQALQMVVLGTLETINMDAAAVELNRIADKVVDTGELKTFKRTLNSSEMYQAEQNLKKWTKAAEDDKTSYGQQQTKSFTPMSDSVRERVKAQQKLTELREKEPSIAEQILQFKIKNQPALRTLHQAIQRSEWLNIVFDPEEATREVGAKRKLLHADICKQEASDRRFDIGVTQATPESEMLLRIRQERAVTGKLDSLRVNDPFARSYLIGTTRTLTYRAMVKESEKYRNEEGARRARIAARRDHLISKVDKDRSEELVLERSKAVVEFVRSFEIEGDGGQIAKKIAAKQKLSELNRAIELEFIAGKTVSNSDPALVLKDFSEEMFHPLLTPIFQAYATTKWLELRYQSTGPVTLDASFKRMEALISDAPFFDRSNLGREELAELVVLDTDFNTRTLRAFKTTILEACEGKIISEEAQRKMMMPVTNLALVTLKLEVKELAKKKKEAIQKIQKQEADDATARQERWMKERLDEALRTSAEDLKIVRDQLLTLKNYYKQEFEPRQGLFPQDTADKMLKKLNTQIESDDREGLLAPRNAPPVSPRSSPRPSPRPSPRREELLSPTIDQTFLNGFLTTSMSHQEKLAKLKEIQDKLKETQSPLHEEINRLRRLESEREVALKDAVTSLKKVHAKLATLKKPPYNKNERYRENLIAVVVSGQEEELQPVFVNINRDDLLELDSSQMDEINLALGNFDADQLRKIVEEATKVEEELNSKIELTKETREHELKKETTKALEKLNEVRGKLEQLKGEPFVLEVGKRQNIYLPSFRTLDLDPETLRVLFRNVNTIYNDKTRFEELFKDKVLGVALTSVEEKDLKTPYESKISFLKKAQEKSDEIILLLNAQITRLKQEQDNELDALMQRAVAEMAPLHELKKLLNELGVTDKNLLDDHLNDLTNRHDPSVKAVLSFYKKADLEKDRTEQALETLNDAVAGQGTFAHKKTLLQNIAPTVKAAFDKLNQELDRAQKEIARKRNDELNDGERAAINALKEVRTKLVDLKDDHAIGLLERDGLMAAKLVDAVDLTPIFTEINKNVGEIDRDEVDQNWEDLLKDAIDRELGDPAPTDPVEIHERKIGFLEKLEAKAKEVEEGLVAAIDSKLNAQQVARRQELKIRKDGLLGDFDKIREKLEILKNPYQESVAQREELYSEGLYSGSRLKSPTLTSILNNINGNVGEPDAEVVAVADDVVGILDNKIEAEKRKAPATDELAQHKGAMKWIDSAIINTAKVDKALQAEIDRKVREAKEELERQRELREEKEREYQIKEANEIFKIKYGNAIDALSRVHGRLNRLKNAPHDRSPESREELFLPTLLGTNPTFLSVFQNVNAGVEGLQDKQDSDIRGAITRHLNQALRSLNSDSLMTDSSPAAAHEKMMKFLTSAPIYCDDVTTKAGQIEELLKAAELEKLKDLAAASLEPLDAKKRELVVLGVENVNDLLKDLPTDGSNAVNDAATNQVKEFYLICDPAGELAVVNAVAKASVEEAPSKLSVDATFEQKEALLQAIQAKAAEALAVLRGQKRDKEAQNQSIEIAVVSLLALHKAKQGLKNPVSNLDGLRDPHNPLALEAVKKFYEEADEANGTQEAIKHYIVDALTSQENASSTDKQKFLDAIPEIVEGALNALRKSEKEREMERLINAATDSLVPIHTAKTRLAAFPTNDLNLLDDLVNPDPRIPANVPALERVKNFYRNAVVTDGSRQPYDQARKSILADQIMAHIAYLDDDRIFEETKEFLTAIPPMAKLAAQSLEKAATTKEAIATVKVEFTNNAILSGLADKLATNLVLIHTAKKGLKQPADEDLLDSLAPLEGEFQGQQAVNLVRQFYKDADVAEDTKDPKNQALDVLKRYVVNSALTFDENKALFLAIGAVVGRAVEMLNKVKEAEELSELLEAAADSLEPIHEAKKGLKNPNEDWLEELAPKGNGLDQARAVALVKKFYEEASVEDGAGTSKEQALTALQQDVIEDKTLAPEEKKKLLEAVIDVAKRANALLSQAKEIEEFSDLFDAAVKRLIPIHGVKGELTRIRADNPELLKDLLGDNPLAVDMVRQFYQNLDVSKDAEEQARISLQVALWDLDPTTQRNLIIDVPVIAEEAVTILRKALQQSKEYAKAENLELAAAVEAMNKVREKLIVLKDAHEVSLDERVELLQRNFQDGDDTDVVGLFYDLNSGVTEIGKSVSLENKEEMINLVIPRPLGEITQQGKHAAAIEFLAALKIKAAEIEQDLQREIEDRAALKTQEREALKSVGNLYDTMESLQSSHGIDATNRSKLFPHVNPRNQKYEGVFDELNSSVGGSGEGSAKTTATANSIRVGLLQISPRTTGSLSEFYTSVKSRADEIKEALAIKLLIEQERASRSGGPMSQVDFIYPSFTRIIESSRSKRDNIFYPPVEGVTYNRCRPVLNGVTQAQQKMIDDKFDFVTTKSPKDLSTADEVKIEINDLMTRANGVLRGKQRDAGLTEQEMAIAILLSIKHGGIMSDETDSEAVINDLKKVNNFGEDEEGQTKAVALYFRMASFAENFQKLAATAGFLTGNSKESKYAAERHEEIQTGLRLKRLPPNYSRDLFAQGGGKIDKWEGICSKIDLTVDVLSRPVGSVSEVVSVTRPISAISQSSGRGGSRFN